MADFYSSVVDFFTSIGDFIGMLVDSFKNFFVMLTTISGFKSVAFVGVPTFILPFIALCFTCLIIKLILDLL